MECFRPANDGFVKLVLSPLEKSKAVIFRLHNDALQLCSRSGQALASYPLDIIKWTPCALPGGRDHCLSLQINTGGPKELLFRAHDRNLVASLISRLDLAARNIAAKKQQQEQNNVHVFAHAAPEPEEEPQDGPLDGPLTTSISFGPADTQDEDVDIVHSRHESSSSLACSAKRENFCPGCMQLSSITADHAAQSRQLQEMRQDLTQALDKLKSVSSERAALEDRLQAALTDGRERLEAATAAARQKEHELQTSLDESVDRCERLIEEMKVLLTKLDAERETVAQLKVSLETAEDEKRLILASLTTAQAQLYDARTAFQDTSKQLEGAAKSCSNAKSQASAAHSELAQARKEYDAVKKERDIAHAEAEKLKQQLAASQLVWSTEKADLESSINHLRGQISFDEQMAWAKELQNKVTELKRQLHEVQRAGHVNEDYEHALSAAHAEAAEARRREDSQLASTETARQQVCVLQKELAAAERRASEAERSVDAATQQAKEARAELSMALASSATARRSEIEVSAQIEKLELERDRALREKEALSMKLKGLEEMQKQEGQAE